MRVLGLVCFSQAQIVYYTLSPAPSFCRDHPISIHPDLPNFTGCLCSVTGDPYCWLGGIRIFKLAVGTKLPLKEGPWLQLPPTVRAPEPPILRITVTKLPTLGVSVSGSEAV